MPFTFAHPAAAIPLRPLLGKYGVMSALVIGSMSPDFAYFLPVTFAREGSHSLAGLFWFCLPLGLIAYLLFHKVMKAPLADLVPPQLGYRDTDSKLPTKPYLAVLLSLLIGAITHIIWDSFTHDGGYMVTTLPALQQKLFSMHGYHVYFYKMLQHGSSLIGLAFIAWLVIRYFQNQPTSAATTRISSAKRYLAYLWLIGLPTLAGLTAIINIDTWPEAYGPAL